MNNISINKLFTFLVDVDSDFNPTLSSQVDLNTYSERLLRDANLMVEFDDNGNIIALVVIYVNEPNNPNAYIPLVAVAKVHRRKGFAKKLVLKAIDVAKQHKKTVVGIHTNNAFAYKMYKKIGFIDVKGEENKSGHQKLKYFL